MKKLYLKPSIKILSIGSSCNLLQTSDGPSIGDEGQDAGSKRFTGGIEFDDEEDTGSDSAW